MIVSVLIGSLPADTVIALVVSEDNLLIMFDERVTYRGSSVLGPLKRPTRSRIKPRIANVHKSRLNAPLLFRKV